MEDLDINSLEDACKFFGFDDNIFIGCLQIDQPLLNHIDRKVRDYYKFQLISEALNRSYDLRDGEDLLYITFYMSSGISSNGDFLIGSIEGRKLYVYAKLSLVDVPRLGLSDSGYEVDQLTSDIYFNNPIVGSYFLKRFGKEYFEYRVLDKIVIHWDNED